MWVPRPWRAEGERVLGEDQGARGQHGPHSTEPESGLSLLFRVRWITRQ